MPCLFCQFISGRRKKNRNGFPFLLLYQTENTLSFLSIDFPANKGGHILVVPRKHFARLEEIALKILHELMDHVQLAAKVVQQEHPGCNILLNNGKEAGQYVAHVHFHVIPRDKNDGIEVELWKRAKITEREFKAMGEKLKRSFQGLK